MEDAIANLVYDVSVTTEKVIYVGLGVALVIMLLKGLARRFM